MTEITLKGTDSTSSPINIGSTNVYLGSLVKENELTTTLTEGESTSKSEFVKSTDANRLRTLCATGCYKAISAICHWSTAYDCSSNSTNKNETKTISRIPNHPTIKY